MAQSRPPRTFPGLTEEQSAGIFAELDRLRADVNSVEGLSSSNRIISDDVYIARPGEVLRLSPRANARQRLMLPPPQKSKIGQFVDALVDCSRDGSVIVSCSATFASNLVGTGLVNGERTMTISATGWYRFECDGAKGWFAGGTGPAGPAGSNGATGATGPAGADSAMRRLYKEVYYTNGDCEIYDEDDALISTSTLGTWSRTSSGKTSGNRYFVWVVPGGPSGARGARANAANVAGSGGSGGGYIADGWYDGVFLDAFIATLGTDIPCTVGAGGAPVAGLASGAGNANSAPANPGALSSFGTLLVAFPGAGGVGSTTSQQGSGGGGAFGAGNVPATLSGTGGRPQTDIGSNGLDEDHGGGGGGSGGGGSNAAGASVHGGGGGGGGQTAATAANGLPGGRSLKGCGASGAAGGAQTASLARSGAAGGKTGFDADGLTVGGGGTAGVVGGTIDGGDGADGVLGIRGGAGGGGGAGNRNTAGNGASGAGGDGGFPGGAGGPSGGACVNAGNSTVPDSGAGGDGAVVVFTFA